MKRLLVVADNSLIVEAIAIGLRRSGEFEMLGHLEGRRASPRAILAASPDVVLLDDMDRSDDTIALIRGIKQEREHLDVIVLTLRMDAEWLDAVFDAGATSAVSKATPPAALTTLIRETLDGHVLYTHRTLGSATAAGRRSVRVGGATLTTREVKVLQLVAEGLSNAEIAQKLWVTEQTVKFHLSNVYRKLDVTNRTEASHFAHVHGLLAGGPGSSG